MKGLKKNIDKSRNFNFQNLIFSHFFRLDIAIKRIPHIFPWLCAWDVCYIIFCHLLHIHSGKTGILFSLLLCSLWWVQILFVCLYITPSHYHHCANLSEEIELIKCLSDIFCWVCEWDWAYSLSYPLYKIWGCVFSVCQSPLWWLRWYILWLIIIIKSEVWSITQCLGLGHETMVWAVCLYSYCFISEIANIIAVICLSKNNYKNK